MRAIALLAWWQLWNAIRTTLSQPRKLIPLLVVLFAFGFQIFIQIFAGSLSRPRYGPIPLGPLPDPSLVLGPVLLLILALCVLAAMGNGLQGNSLVFSPADADYLFSTPLSRRLVLAYRIPAMLLQPLLFSFGITIASQSFLRSSQYTAHLRIGPTFMAVFLSFVIYQQVGLAFHLFLSEAYRTIIRHSLSALAILIIVLGAVGFKLHGSEGIADLGRNPLLRAFFAPCTLSVNAIIGAPFALSFAPLIVLFVAAVCLILLRESNYYERAVVNTERIAKARDAIKSGDIGAAYRMRQSQARRGLARRAYTIPVFGRGAAAIAWAHLAAAWKNPLLTFYAPFFGGLIIAIFAGLSGKDSTALMVAGADAYFIVFMVQISGKGLCFRALQMQPITRPLPLPPSHVVAADIIPAGFTSSLFGWGAAIPLLFNPGPMSQTVAFMLLFVAPFLVVSKLLIQYLLTFWYPNAQDKLQQMISSMVNLFLTAIHFAVLAPSLIIPVILNAPIWVSVTIGFIVSVVLTAIWFFLTVSAYTRYQPHEGGSVRG